MHNMCQEEAVVSSCQSNPEGEALHMSSACIMAYSSTSTALQGGRWAAVLSVTAAGVHNRVSLI